MRAGRLSRLMMLQVSSKTRAVGGKWTITWADLGNVWAALIPLSGDELQIARATDSKATHEITIRYRSDVTPKHRLTWSGRTFNIKSAIDVQGRNRELTLMCAEDL